MGVAAAALAVGLTVVGLQPASAWTTTVNCTGDITITGYSSPSNGGFTTNGKYCGTAKVRLLYKTYSNSPTYFTPWQTSKETATAKNPGNIVLGGQHGVSKPAPAYPEAKNFTSQ